MQMRSSSDKDMEKELGVFLFAFFFSEFAAPVETFFLLESSHQKLVPSVCHLRITVDFLVKLIKISYNSIQEKQYIYPNMSVVWLITSQLDLNA